MSCYIYFRFPTNVEKRLMWFIQLGFKPDSVIKSRSRICSEHFDSSDFFCRSDGVKHLTKDAYPIPYPNIFAEPCMR